MSTSPHVSPSTRARTAGGGRRLTALGASLAIHGTLFAGLSLWGVVAFGGKPEVRAARLELAEAFEPLPVVDPDPSLEVEPLAEPLADAVPPELVPVEPVLPRETPPDLPAPEPPLEDLAALDPPRLPLQPLARSARAPETPPERADSALDELTSAEVEPPDVAGQDEDRAPVLLDAPEPRYPPLALHRRWEGTVVLRLWVAPDGTVTDVAVETSSGFAVLDDAALRAVRTWRFDGGRLRTVDVLHAVRFQLLAD